MKAIKCNLFWFIIGAVLFTGIGVIAANSLNAKDILYRDTNVEVAIDDLYSRSTIPINGYITTYDVDDLKVGGSATKTNGSINLTTSSDFQWGPQKTLDAGCYLVVYNGDNLNGDITYDVVGSSGNIQHPTILKMKDFAFYTVSIPANETNFEFRLWKTSNTGTVKVNSISIFASNNCS